MLKSLSATSGEYGGWGGTDQQESKIFPRWFLLNVVLRYQGEARRFSNWRVQGFFLAFMSVD